MKIDFILPVYNEQSILKTSLNHLYTFLQVNTTYEWRIIIADNASTDDTPTIAAALASEFFEVSTLRFEKKGRGFALRQTFQASQADVVAYMDIDLSTNLHHINDLVKGLQSGYDIVIGSRLLPDSKTDRSFKREIISRGYNLLVRLLFGNVCSDLQCGFKAFRIGAIKNLLPVVEDDRFFFDTEVLLQAKHNGSEILDVPVEWIENPDSRVDLLPTILEDLLGLWRVRLNLSRPFF
jgi:glycosyltransferase involved in cell wall biosynthesis|tara:strand:+ start:771 stop:1481 length:711 start_codon:yes stop_codon:yes gene_type:complete